MYNWGTTDSIIGIGNSFGGAYQCYGFSLFLALVIFGKRITYNDVYNAPDGTNLGNGWVLYRNNYSSINLAPGDLIRVENGSINHSAVVWKIENDNVFVVECWGSVSNKLAWGNWNGSSSSISTSQMKSMATYIIKAPKTTQTVTVSFNANGGTCATTSMQVNVGGVYGSLPVPNKANYLFGGWWYDINTESNEIISNTVVSQTTDHVLYAHWAKVYKITNVGAGICLNIYGTNVTTLYDGKNVTLWSDSGTNEQKWVIKELALNQSTSSVYVRSIIDLLYGLNVSSGAKLFECDVHSIIGNSNNSQINFIYTSSGYKIKLVNYPLYLTAASSSIGANAYWSMSSNSQYQLWTFSVI